MKRQRYRCPDCGKKVVFGEHFCLAGVIDGKLAPENTHESHPPRAGNGPLKKLGTLLIVAFLAGALLWPFLEWKSTLVVGLIIIAGVGIALFFGSKSQTSAGPIYRSLVKMTGGDRSVAERLITAELNRYPDFSRSECIRRVHDRLEYEQRR